MATKKISNRLSVDGPDEHGGYRLRTYHGGITRLITPLTRSEADALILALRQTEETQP